MKKIMFSDAYGLTEAVLSGRKTQTRRICKYDRPSADYDIAFPVFEEKDYDNDNNNISPLDGAFCWMNAAGDYTGWNIPKYKEGEVVAVAQSYKSLFEEDCQRVKEGKPICNVTIKNVSDHPGWTNKMFVRADQMFHQIRITDVRLGRLNKISDADCLAEGVYVGTSGITYHVMNLGICANTPQEAYAALIDRISGKGTWESNPWVFVYDFELIK